MSKEVTQVSKRTLQRRAKAKRDAIKALEEQNSLNVRQQAFINAEDDLGYMFILPIGLFLMGAFVLAVLVAGLVWVVTR